MSPFMYLPMSHCALPKYCQHAAKKIIWFCVVLLNNCMKKPKDRLSHAQYQINHKADKDTLTVNKWIGTSGLNVKSFNTTPIQLLQAQKSARELLTQYPQLLTQHQINTLKSFNKLMVCKRTRAQLKPQHAYPILNISTKINRQLFKLNKQLNKESNSTGTE